MKRDAPFLNDQVDDLLTSWHHWSSHYREGRGYPHTAAGCESWRCSRQHDDANGALDIALETTTMRAVDFEIGELSMLHRAAIMERAKNLAVGKKVFFHPRLPDDKLERQPIIDAARREILRRMVKRGLVEAVT